MAGNWLARAAAYQIKIWLLRQRIAINQPLANCYRLSNRKILLR